MTLFQETERMISTCTDAKAFEAFRKATADRLWDQTSRDEQELIFKLAKKFSRKSSHPLALECAFLAFDIVRAQAAKAR